MGSSVSNQIMEQQADFKTINNYIFVSDTSSAGVSQDTIYVFYRPEELSVTDSLYQELINPLTAKSKSPGDSGYAPKLKSQYIPDWTIGGILLLFVLLASIRNASDSYLLQLFQSAFNRKVARRLFHEKVSTLFSITFRLDAFFFLVTGVFIYQVVSYFSDFSFAEGLAYCGLIILGYFLYKVLKFFLYRISGAIFDVSAEIREFIFHVKTGNRIMGIILFPLVLILFLAQGNFTEYLVYFGIISTAILFVMSILRGVVIIAQKVFSVYYLILYLCTLEILPLLLAGKILLIV